MSDHQAGLDRATLAEAERTRRSRVGIERRLIAVATAVVERRAELTVAQQRLDAAERELVDVVAEIDR